MAGYLAACVIARFVDFFSSSSRLVGQVIDRLLYWLIGWLIDVAWTMDWLISYSTDHLIVQGKGESGSAYSSRYIGSMVGDVHRTLLYGGIFGYPGDTKNPTGTPCCLFCLFFFRRFFFRWENLIFFPLVHNRENTRAKGYRLYVPCLFFSGVLPAWKN